jgi:hypothetical protein
LKSAIWSTAIQGNKELQKKPEILNQLKQLLCDDADFWKKVGLIEELLRPLKSSILAIEGSVIEVRTAYKTVESAFQEALKIANKFSKEQSKQLKQV